MLPPGDSPWEMSLFLPKSINVQLLKVDWPCCLQEVVRSFPTPMGAGQSAHISESIGYGEIK